MLPRIKSLQSRSKNVIFNSFLLLVYKTVSILLSFVTTPLMLSCLGQEKYGVWATLLSLISWIYYFDLGIGSGVRNKLSSSIALNDFFTAKCVLCLGYVLTTFISITLVLVASIFLFFFDLSSILSFGFSDENINKVFYFSFLLACINFVASLVNNVFYAVQKSSLVSFFNIIGQLVFVLALLIFIKSGDTFLLYVALAEGGSQLLKNIIAQVYFFLKNKKLRFTFSNLHFSYSKFIMTFGFQMFVLQIAALILNCTDNVIISKFFGAHEVTPYSICYKYFGLVYTIFIIILTPLLSAYTEAYAKRDYLWIQKSLINSIILYILFFIVLIISYCFFNEFTIFWLHIDLKFKTSLVSLITLYFALLMFSCVFSTFLAGIGTIGEATVITACQAIINIPISIYLGKFLEFGVNGVIMGSICSILLSAILMPYKVFKTIKSIK